MRKQIGNMRQREENVIKTKTSLDEKIIIITGEGNTGLGRDDEEVGT